MDASGEASIQVGQFGRPGVGEDDRGRTEGAQSHSTLCGQPPPALLVEGEGRPSTRGSIPAKNARFAHHLGNHPANESRCGRPYRVLERGDIDNARKWFQTAANHGDPRARATLDRLPY